MTKRITHLTCTLMVLALAPSAFAQDFAINWHTIDGGGGFSSGGGFGLAGTIAQPDAGALTGGDFKLVGGFGSATAPAIQDADADGIEDGADNCPNTPNPGQEDADVDGIGDVCDTCPNDPDNDIDADGVCGDVDNCPAVANPGQEDADVDGIGDACDNCPNTYNPGQEDQDADGIGDACESNTPPGTNVDVQPVDETTGQPAPVTMTFDEVLTAGDTTVTSSAPSGNEVLPQGFILGDPPVFYDISTTATFAGDVQVCFDYSGLSFTDDQNLRLFHSSDGIVWFDITTSLDTQNDIICGLTSSFSFFGVFETVDSDADGLLDATEYEIAEGSGCPDPSNPDSDGDTLSDGEEVTLGTDPCNPDTDADGLRDDVDPNPLVPDQTGGALEQDLRTLADGILALDLGLFNGPNNNANRGRRNALANRAMDAANALAAEDIATAIDEMSSLLDKIDGQSRPPDWMAATQDKADLADDVLALIAALEGP